MVTSEKTVKAAVEPCTVAHLHWHRFRCWEWIASLPLVALWVTLIFVLPAQGVSLIVALPLDLTVYAAILLLIRHGRRRVG